MENQISKKWIFILAGIGIGVAVVIAALYFPGHAKNAEIIDCAVAAEDVVEKVGVVPIDTLRENYKNETATILTEEQAQQIIDENNSHYTTVFSKNYDALWVEHEKNQITRLTQYSFDNLPDFEIKVGGECLGYTTTSAKIDGDTATSVGNVKSYSVDIDRDDESGKYTVDLTFWETPYCTMSFVKRDGNWVLDTENHSSEGNEVSADDAPNDQYDTLDEALTAAEDLDIDAINPFNDTP